ncbi:MAG: hypothetical protein WBN88_20625 [Anderseniella sp.]
MPIASEQIVDCKYNLYWQRSATEIFQSAALKEKRGRQNPPRFQNCLLGCQILWTAIATTYATAIAASAFKSATAAPANPAAGAGV